MQTQQPCVDLNESTAFKVRAHLGELLGRASIPPYPDSGSRHQPLGGNL